MKCFAVFCFVLIVGVSFGAVVGDEKKMHEAFMRRLSPYQPKEGLLLQHEEKESEGWPLRFVSAAFIKLNLPMIAKQEMDCDVYFEVFSTREEVLSYFRSRRMTAAGPGNDFNDLRGFDHLATRGERTVSGTIGNVFVSFVFDTRGDGFKADDGNAAYVGWHAGMADLLLDVIKEATGQPHRDLRELRYVNAEPGKTWAESVIPPIHRPNLAATVPSARTEKTDLENAHVPERDQEEGLAWAQIGTILLVILALLGAWKIWRKGNLVTR